MIMKCRGELEDAGRNWKPHLEMLSTGRIQGQLLVSLRDFKARKQLASLLLGMWQFQRSLTYGVRVISFHTYKWSEGAPPLIGVPWYWKLSTFQGS